MTRWRGKVGLSLLFLLACCLGANFWISQSSQAASLKMRPLIYREMLKPGEAKKGFVDIANPSDTIMTLRTDVKAFRQLDASGRLEFYNSKEMSEAITVDLNSFELKPQEGIRLYFMVDGKKMTEGDKFAAIFVRQEAEGSSGITPAVSTGTLLVLENGSSGPRKVDIKAINAGFFQWGETVSGKIDVANIASKDQASGFFPKIDLTLGPIATQTQTIEGPLVFAGITRPVAFELPSNRIGLYKLDAKIGQETASKWLFIVTGWWRWVAMAVICLLIVFGTVVYGWHKQRSNKSKDKISQKVI
jgi:hypothetical protein